MEDHLHVAGRAVALDEHATFADLRGFVDPQPLGRRTFRDRSEVLRRAPEDLVGIDIAGDDERGVVRNVEPAIVTVQIVATHGPEIVEPADRGMPVWMCTKRGRGDLGVEELIRIVLAALQLRDDDRPLGFAFRRLEQAVRHPLGLDEEHLIERGAPGRFQVSRLVDPGVAVPHAAKPFDDPLHLLARNVGRALEIHVLDPVRHAREARAFVAGADAVPAPHRYERSGVDFLDQNLEAVIERRTPDRSPPGRNEGDRHSSIIQAGFEAFWAFEALDLLYFIGIFAIFCMARRLLPPC